ncbi:uncharacterized protein APUU_50172A [Aspergillus puulaauensis]|uniref:Nucleoside phosphorylase domain-containing protein n=1 Tax=Aspergillus puulaauensis TaxID=1220207 RepID=A0A7R7XPS2_9EURO|nr:uncharacterized protein APUU_50172A [Aspergillus puulaauensis]BCS25461.1 hypothetical protein APUU_50172A [Aspergillus puulaauensis]
MQVSTNSDSRGDHPTNRPCRPAGRAGFEIAITCALTVEGNAIEALLDEEYETDGFSYGKAYGDTNTYTTGKLANQNVVIVYMPDDGIANAAGAAASLRSSFGGIKMALIVGVCGGVPRTSGGGDIFLGDVIISSSVVQFDHGKQYPNRFLRTDTLGGLSREIGSFAKKLSGDNAQRRIQDKTGEYTAAICGRADFRGSVCPGPDRDILYPPDYRHKHRRHPCEVCQSCVEENDDVCEAALHSSCQSLGCDTEAQRRRSRIQSAHRSSASEDDMAMADIEKARTPRVYFGPIACSNQVMKSARHRDSIAEQLGVIAFEMESAGTWNYVPTVVIKSVADYADCHKSKDWQGYAAVVAAACTKAVLEEWRAADGTLTLPDRVSQGPSFHSVEEAIAAFEKTHEGVRSALDRSKGEVERSEKHCKTHRSEMEDMDEEMATLGNAFYALLGGPITRFITAFDSYMGFLLGSLFLLGLMAKKTDESLGSLIEAEGEINAARVEAELLTNVESELGHQSSEGDYSKGQRSLDGRANIDVPTANTVTQSSDVLARGDGPDSMEIQAERDNNQATTIALESEDSEYLAISRPGQEPSQPSLKLQVARSANHEKQLSLLHRQVNDLREVSDRLDKSQAELRTKIRETRDLLEQEKKMESEIERKKSEIERKEKEAKEQRNKGLFGWCVIL